MKKPQTAKNAALSLLSRREHSRGELEAKLSSRYGAEGIRAALDSLESCGLLSDLRFARAYLKTAGRKFGREKLRENLRARCVSSAVADSAMELEITEKEGLRAYAALSAKTGGAELSGEKARARAVRFLLSRGFSEEDAESAVLRGAKAEWE